MMAGSDPSSLKSGTCSIKVVGIGGGGGNAVDRMVDSIGLANGLDFVAMNTDLQALTRSRAPTTLQLGGEQTRGLGAGGTPDVGRLAAEESADDIAACVTGQDLVFVCAGMGGGTGSGAAPVVAEIARREGAIAVAVVSRPFSFEGKKRSSNAVDSLERLKEAADMLIVVSNDRLLEIVPAGMSMTDAFILADEVLRQGIVGLSEIVTKPGLINVDFADVAAIVSDSGYALMGLGRGFGSGRAMQAASAALSSPLLEFPLADARRVIFTVSGDSTMTLVEINEIAEIISEVVDDDANIIFGTNVDESLGGELCVTVVATDFAGEGV